MDQTTIEFKVLRAGEEVIGCSLVGCGETNAEAFCFSFPFALNKGKAKIRVEETSIRFTHSGYYPEQRGNIMLVSDGGEYTANIERDDAVAIRQLLDLQGPYVGRKLTCSHVQAFAHGFELRALAA